MKRILSTHLFFTFLAFLFATNLCLAQNEFCFFCPDGTTLTLDADNNYYCVNGAGQTVSVPLWAKPLWAKTVVAMPASDGSCPEGYMSTAQSGRTWCVKCPDNYTLRGDFCFECPPGYQFMVAPATNNRRPCTVLMDSDWQRLNNRKGGIQSVQDGILLIGDDWTNGAVKNGYQDGNGVESTKVFDMSRGGQIRLKFSVNGAGRYMALTYWAVSSIKAMNLTTNNTWHGSAKVSDGIWLYSQVTISSDGTYKLTVSQNGYDGVPIATYNGTLQDLRLRLRLEFIDNHAGQKAAVILSEAEVCPN